MAVWCLRVIWSLEDINMEKNISADLGVAVVQRLTVHQSRIVAERFPGSLGCINEKEHGASHMVLVKPPMKSGDW